MKTCERCGQLLPDQTMYCPVCGTMTSTAQGSSESLASSAAESGQQLFTGFEEYTPPPPPAYERNYAANREQATRYSNSGEQAWQQASSTAEQAAGQGYSHSRAQHGVPASIRIFNTNVATPLFVEILASFFLGLYGVGWIMAGETATGIILLIASVVIYWPLIIFALVITVLTFGLALFCFGPFAVGAIFLNAYLLNNTLKRKQAQAVHPK